MAAANAICGLSGRSQEAGLSAGLHNHCYPRCIEARGALAAFSRCPGLVAPLWPLPRLDTQMSDINLDGGYLCGDVRYRLAAAPEPIFYCHCLKCQRASGAPIVAWATVPRAAVTWLAGEPRVHQSSDANCRLYCAACGSQLALRSDAEPDLLEFTVATLDRPGSVVPTHPNRAASRIPWYDVADALPRYRQQSDAPIQNCLPQRTP